MSCTEKPGQRSRPLGIVCVATVALFAFAFELSHAGAIIDFMLAKAWEAYDQAGGSAKGGMNFAMIMLVQIALLALAHALALLIAMLIALALCDDPKDAKTAQVSPAPPDKNSTPDD